MEAATGRLSARPSLGLVVPLAITAVAAATIAYGLLTVAGGGQLGARLAPFLSRWDPDVHGLAIAAVAALGGALAVAPALRSPRVSPLRFAAALLGLALATRLALATARDGIDGWWAVYELPNVESYHEYLPALPALDFGLRFFLDTFAEVGTSLTVHSIGHPPGLLVTMHLLGIDTAPALAALTIGVGALSVPLTYLLARQLLDERAARTAALLYLFAPSAMLYGATAADALYATLAVVAAWLLVSRRRAARAAGPPAFALASFFSYANLAIGAWATLVAARRESLRSATVIAVACGVALLAFYGALHLATGFDPLGTLEATEAVYREGIASRRPYAFWLFGSPVAFLVVLGLPIAWFAARALAGGDAVALALFAVLGIAAVLGFSKAETERIYLFLVPLACVAAAAALPDRFLPPVLVALAVQALASELLLYTVW